jgi:dTDP-4-dehydrorhamnose reductase
MDVRSTKVLFTGVTSIHGWPLFEKLRQRMPPERLMAIRPPKMRIPEDENVRSLCVSDRAGLEEIRERFAPTHVVHCAGVCDLDVCEERPAWAHTINTLGAETVAGVFGASSYLLYMSTDLVFSGNNPPPGCYRETDPLDPVSVAGKTFAAAEAALEKCPNLCIVRLGLPIGGSISGDKGAVDFIENRFRRGLRMTLFHDEIRSCISCEAIADATLTLLDRRVTGLFHLGGDRPCSLYEVGKTIIERGGYAPELLKAISRYEEINGPPRIGNVALNSSKIKTLLRIDKLE